MVYDIIIIDDTNDEYLIIYLEPSASFIPKQKKSLQPAVEYACRSKCT